jgi:hypothetical protein
MVVNKRKILNILKIVYRINELSNVKDWIQIISSLKDTVIVDKLSI